MSWPPHITVGAIVHRNRRFLMVEEVADEGARGRTVFNQPAGHLEPGESLPAAAAREVLEETGWNVTIEALTGVYHYYSPEADITYHRVNFVATPVSRISDDLDEGIVAAHWLTLEEIRTKPLRSPIVLRCIEDYVSRGTVPLDFLRML